MAEAHFIWIEAEPVGKPDAPVEISLFYGEPHEFLREESPGNLDRHAGLQAWVVDPSGERSSPGRLSERDRELGGLLEYDIVPVTRGIDPRAGTFAFLPGYELLVRFTTKTQPTARVRLQAQGPNGWIKEMRPSDSWGVTSFVPLWPGRYVIALERDEPSVGELQGRKYDIISQRVTFSFLVEASR
jgi:hypothetical protein